MRERAIHDDLKNLCAEMNQAQAEEISQMQAWLIEWYNIEYKPQIKPANQEIINRLATLSDTDFEIAFNIQVASGVANAMKLQAFMTVHADTIPDSHIQSGRTTPVSGTLTSRG